LNNNIRLKAKGDWLTAYRFSPKAKKREFLHRVIGPFKGHIFREKL
jgi:hypothetical protein